MSLKGELIRFVESTLTRGQGGRVTADESLIDRGLLDSIGLIQLMEFLESRTGLRVPDHSVTPDNFQTITAIEQMVDGLRQDSS